MIIHIALFKWRDDVSEEDIERVIDDLKLLKGKINEIIDLYCGRNFSKWSKGYTHAVIVKVQNTEALDNYRNHLAHVPIAKKIEELEQDSVGIDIEV